jgi:hypothetical protein
MSMLKMVQVIFTRLKHIHVTHADHESPAPPKGPAVSAMRSPTRMHRPAAPSPRPASLDAIDGDRPSVEASAANSGASINPYGITTVRELLRVLISILDPSD